MTALIGLVFIYILAVSAVLVLLAPLFLFLAAVTVLEGIALLHLKKSTGRSLPCFWLAWIPLFGIADCYKLYALGRFSDTTEVRVFGLTFQKKTTPWLIYLITLAASMILLYVPVVGLVLYFPVSAFMMVWSVGLQYAHLRDLLNTERPENTSNGSTALWIAIGNMLSCGLVRAIYLLVLSNRIGKAASESTDTETAQP